MSVEILLGCVDIIFMGIFVGIIFMSYDFYFYYYYYYDFYFFGVGHMFESLLNEFMEMRDFLG